MKRILKEKIGRILVLGVFALAIIVPAVCHTASEKSQVKVYNREYFTVVEVLGTIVEENYGKEPKLSANTGDLLFGGWFEDQACTVPVTSVNSSKTYYAKYLDPSVLSIKLQVKQNTDNTTDMRVVSTVDSLNYAGAGFDVYFGEQATTEKDPITFQTTTVFERINASTGGVDYKYSPKVVDADSEYFVTGTIKKIAASKANENFYIKPFWVTMDNVKVYGQGRFLSAQNGTDAKNVNIPVEIASDPGDSNGNVSVSFGGATKTAKVAAYKDGFAHLNIPVDNKASLPSATKVTVGSASAIFRNHQNTGATVDTSWYDVDPNANEFVIATKADWEGFASIVNNKKDSFKGDTVFLVANLTLNEGIVDATAGTWTGTATNSTQIGVAKYLSGSTFNVDESIPFDGTFEGDENTISGFYYVTASKDNHAMFQYVGPNGTLQNFTLSDCYMVHTGNGWRMGLLTSALSGSVDNVCLDETTYLKSNGKYIGGFAAVITGETKHNITNSRFGGTVSATEFCGGIASIVAQSKEINIENCWVSGQVKAIGDITATKTGGFVGDTLELGIAMTVKDCLFTGTVSGTQQTAGFLGRQRFNVSYINCVQNGVVTSSATIDSGIIIGYIGNSKRADINNVYTTNKFVCTNSSGMTASKNHEGFGYIYTASAYGFPVILEETELINENGYINTELDFWTPENPDGAWVATANGPELKRFSTAEPITDFGKLQRVSVGWYYEQYNNGVLDEKETYILETSGDVYGLAKISESDSFSDDTIKLAADVDLNPGWDATQETIATNVLIPIGQFKEFSGYFDGQMHTIKGVCVDGGRKQIGCIGLFGRVHFGGTVCNLRIENSYIRNNTTDTNKACVGGAVGSLDGTIDSVYVHNDVVIYSNQTSTGGIVGFMSGESQITGSWFAGEVTGEDINNKGLTGGIVGCVADVNGVVEAKKIINCLNTGTVVSHTWDLGGLVGGTADGGLPTTLTIKDSLNVGKVKSTGQSYYVDSLIGGLETYNTHFFVENVYTTGDLEIGSPNTYNGKKDNALPGICMIKPSTNNNTVTGMTKLVTNEQLTGNNAYLNTELDFWSDDNANGAWVASTVGTPQLKKFTTYTDAQIQNGYDGTEQIVHTGWYDAKAYVNGEQLERATAVSDYQVKTAADMYGLEQLVNSKKDVFVNDVITVMNDIDFNPGWDATTKKVAPNVLNPIGKDVGFEGTFDGNNKTIRGLCIDHASQTVKKDNNGLFGLVLANGTIRNIRLENSYIKSENIGGAGWYNGSIVGRLHGNVYNIYAHTNVIVDSTTAGTTGGIVGNCYYAGVSSINNCWFAGTVSTNANNCGGIVGMARNGTKTIENCLNTGLVKGNACIGGIVGYVDSNQSGAVTVTVRNSMNLGTVTATNVEQVGPIVGAIKGIDGKTAQVTLENTYTNDNKSVGFGSMSVHASINAPYNTIKGIACPLTSNELKGANAYINTALDFWSTDNETGVWSVSASGQPELKMFTSATPISSFAGKTRVGTGWCFNNFVNDYAQGNTTDPMTLVITASDQMYGFATISQKYDFADCTLRLGKDIAVNDVNAADSDKTNWTPIGQVTDGYRFAGTFDGDNKTLSGVYAKEWRTYLGLFAGTEYGSVIKNLRLKQSYFENLVTGNSRGIVGSIVADCRGTLDNVYSNATVVNNNYHSGGLVAWSHGLDYITNKATTIEMKNCWYDGDMKIGSDGRYIGGLTAEVRKGTLKMENCLFSGDIVSEYHNSDYTFLGGMFGTIRHSDSNASSLNTVSMESCISAGKITEANKGKGVGAIAGRLQWQVSGDTAVNWTKVNMSNVFASKDCYGTDISFPWQKKIDKTYDYAFLDTLQVEGRVVWTHGKDRLMGYCVESDLTNVGTNSQAVVTGKQKLDFTNDFAMRNSGVPIPRTMTDVVPSSMITDMSQLYTQVGFGHFGRENSGWSLADAEHMGMGNYVKKQTSASKSSHYDDYITRMIGQGYKVYADNAAGAAVDGVYNTTLVKDSGDWVISVTFVEKLKEITLSISTVGSAGVSKHLNSDTSDSLRNSSATGTVTLTMGQLTNDSEGLITSGNQFFFQLPNGHFIVNDGAHNTELEPLIDKMQALADAKNMDKIYIDAWIISHQHGDHNGVFSQFWKQPELVDRVVVEGVYLSEPNDATFQLEDYYKWRVGGVDNTIVVSSDFRRSTAQQYAGTNLLKNKAGGKTPVYRFHTGERYHFNGLTMDVIFTQEQMPLLDKNVYLCEGIFNSVSTILVYTTQSGQKIYMSGDATHLATDWVVKAYDSCGMRTSYTQTQLANSSITNALAGISSTYITGKKASEILSGINVYVVPHHGMNTLIPFARYLATPEGVNASTSSATMNKFDSILFPYWKIRKTANDTTGMAERDIAYETQDHANQWLVNNLAKDLSKVKHYNSGDVTVTINGSTITVAQ